MEIHSAVKMDALMAVAMASIEVGNLEPKRAYFLAG